MKIQVDGGGTLILTTACHYFQLSISTEPLLLLLCLLVVVVVVARQHRSTPKAEIFYSSDVNIGKGYRAPGFRFYG